MALQNLSPQSLKSFLAKSNGSVVLWGAGDIGELIKIAFGKAGINLVKEKYDPNNITSNIINIYLDLVNAKN